MGWQNVILAMANIWPVVLCIVVMLSLKMSMLLLLTLKARGLFSLLTGVLPVLNVELIINHLQKFLHELTISLILCMLNVLLFIGMWVKVWKKVNFLKLVKIWLLWRRIMKKLVQTVQKKATKVKMITMTKMAVMMSKLGSEVGDKFKSLIFHYSIEG